MDKFISPEKKMATQNFLISTNTLEPSAKPSGTCGLRLFHGQSTLGGADTANERTVGTTSVPPAHTGCSPGVSQGCQPHAELAQTTG